MADSRPWDQSKGRFMAALFFKLFERPTTMTSKDKENIKISKEEMARLLGPTRPWKNYLYALLALTVLLAIFAVCAFLLWNMNQKGVAALAILMGIITFFGQNVAFVFMIKSKQKSLAIEEQLKIERANGGQGLKDGTATTEPSSNSTPSEDSPTSN